MKKSIHEERKTEDMTAKERFESAKEIYASYGVDVEAAIEK